MRIKKRFFLCLVLPFVAGGVLRAQCACSANTSLIPPSIDIPGPPRWFVGGMITDAGTIDGVCPRAGCENERKCQHALMINVTVTFRFAPPPAPPLPVPSADVLLDTLKFPLPWTSYLVLPNGTARLTSSFNVTLYTACATTEDDVAPFQLRWTGPEGAVIMSGSATVSCKKC
jgi:hypothetical protein